MAATPKPEPAKPAHRPARAVPTPAKSPQPGAAAQTSEVGGPQGPEPTRYGDWERNGRCIDF